MTHDPERTLPPTPRRLAKARAQGQCARSACAAAALTLGSCAMLTAVAGTAVGWWVCLARDAALRAAAAGHASAADLVAGAVVLVRAPAPWSVVACAWICGAGSSLLAAAACGGISPAWASLRIDATRISWGAGAKRLATFDIAGAAVALFGTAAVAIAAAAAVRTWSGIAGQAADFNAVACALGGALAQLWRGAALGALAIGAADIAVQRTRLHRALRMSAREVKEERTENEGRPETKARRRTVSAKRARGLRIGAIAQATAVVTNPTHVAVALRYDPPRIDVPAVVARGADLMAAVVRGAAENFGVPIVEAPELARMLYEHTETDDPIPEEAYAAVAAVFAWILRTRGTLGGGAREEGTEAEAS
jgi:flagellar biosynthetic protein FlhB